MEFLQQVEGFIKDLLHTKRKCLKYWQFSIWTNKMDQNDIQQSVEY